MGGADLLYSANEWSAAGGAGWLYNIFQLVVLARCAVPANGWGWLAVHYLLVKVNVVGGATSCAVYASGWGY